MQQRCRRWIGLGVPALLALLAACGGGTKAGVGIGDVWVGETKVIVVGDHTPGQDVATVDGDEVDAEAMADAPDPTPADGGSDLATDALPADVAADSTWVDVPADATPDAADAPADCDGPCDVEKCQAGPAFCQENQRWRCLPDGTWAIEDCAPLFCTDGNCLTCIPDLVGCLGNDVAKCRTDGSAWEVTESCDTDNTGRVCEVGKCVSQCDKAGPRSNAGCEYWPVDLDQNYEFDAENQQFAVIVSNLSNQFAAQVTVYKDGLVEQQVTVAKNDLSIILLDPYNIDTAGVADPAKLLSRRLVSTSPIVAYQFNPLANVGVFSNDASLLLPTNALGTTYRVMSWFQRSDEIASYFTVVPVDPGNTQVTLTVSAPTLAGAGLDALAAGGTTTVTLQQGQVLHVKATGACVDLTGSLVTADKRLEVMGGHECANVPMDATCSTAFCCCDHLEEQMFPVDTWGMHYVLAHLYPRGQAQDTIRVMASAPNTTVTVTGANVTVPTLDAGKYYDFRITSNVEVTANRPILVAQYMEGQTSPTGCSDTCDDTGLFGKTCGGVPIVGKSCNNDTDCCPGVAGIGDPSLILAVPVEQFRNDYVFLVPTKYAYNYVNVIAPAGATVTLDGSPIPVGQFQPIASGTLVATAMAVTEGVHRLSAPEKINVVVYGWDQYVSYGYAGGMNVNTLTAP